MTTQASLVLTDEICGNIAKLYKNATKNYVEFNNYLKNLYQNNLVEFNRYLFVLLYLELFFNITKIYRDEFRIRECLSSVDNDDIAAFRDIEHVRHASVLQRTLRQFIRLRNELFSKKDDPATFPLLGEGDVDNADSCVDADVDIKACCNTNSLNNDNHNDNHNDNDNDNNNNNNNNNNATCATDEKIDPTNVVIANTDGDIKGSNDNIHGTIVKDNTNNNEDVNKNNKDDGNSQISVKERDVFLYIIFRGCENFIKIGLNSMTLEKFQTRYHTYYGEFEYLKYSLNDLESTEVARKVGRAIEKEFKTMHEDDSSFFSCELYDKKVNEIDMLPVYKKSMFDVMNRHLSDRVSCFFLSLFGVILLKTFCRA